MKKKTTIFGISSVWKSALIKNGKDLLYELEKTGIPALELEYRISSDTFNQLKNSLHNSELKVLSLHNYCPHPDVLPPDRKSGDAFRLSALDENERQLVKG